MVRKSGMEVYFPSGNLVKKVPLKEDGQHDFNLLSQVLRAVKDKVSDKRDALIMSASDVDYQTLINTMDTVKSYQTVVAASLVEVELFPEISLGDANKK